MKRIDTPDEQFHDGDPVEGVQGTIVTADFLNAVQEEIANAIELSGIALDPEDPTQLFQAIRTQVAAELPKRHHTAVNLFLYQNFGGF